MAFEYTYSDIRFLQPGSNDDLLIITLPEPKKIDSLPKEPNTLSKRWSTSDQDCVTIEHQRESDSPTTPLFNKGFCKEDHDKSEDGHPTLQRQYTGDHAADILRMEAEKNSKIGVNTEISSRKLSKSLKNFNPTSKEHEIDDNNLSNTQYPGQEVKFPGENNQNDAPQMNTSHPNLLINIAAVRVMNSQPGISSARLSRGGGQVQSSHNIEDQKKKKDKISIIEDMKLEVYENELHIINNLNEEIIPLDSLKVSTIHDISKNIQDKFHMDTLDQDEQFLLESKLGKIPLYKAVL